jgi:FkbM family methyltransferase
VFHSPAAVEKSHDQHTHTLSRLEIFEFDFYNRFNFLEDALRCEDGNIDSKIVVDVGANIGLFGLRCLTQCRQHDNVALCYVAIEPLNDMCSLLTNNFLNNQGERDQLRVVRAAISSQRAASASFYHFANVPGESTLFKEEAIAQQSLIAAQRRLAIDAPLEIACRVETLSSIVDEQRLERIDFLKLDVEGSELLALSGIVDAHWPLIGAVAAEVHDVDDRLLRVVRLLKQHFDTVCFGRQHDQTFVDPHTGEPEYQLHVPTELALFYVFANKNTHSHHPNRAKQAESKTRPI